MQALRCLRQSRPLVPLSCKRICRRSFHQSTPHFILESLFEPIPEKEPKKLDNRARAFDPEADLFFKEDRKDWEDEWEATMWNGTIPILFVGMCYWGFSEKWMRTLPTVNDGEFGPMRYAGNPDARYWGNYRYDIQSRKGRRQFDWGM
jgi:hypothetical protein